MRIDAATLERRLDALYSVGSDPAGGAYRPLYSPPWAEACELVERWMRDAGLATRRDAVGNIWGRAEGANGDKCIVTGSHIDTVRRGGRLDGALGICAGLTALEALLAADRKSTRLNSSHLVISYAVFCLKKKKTNILQPVLTY